MKSDPKRCRSLAAVRSFFLSKIWKISIKVSAMKRFGRCFITFPPMPDMMKLLGAISKGNESFSVTLLDAIRPDDTVWIHDYHLMLLPYLLRKALPKVRIGFFLHIPFPQFEIFRLMPGKWRRAILEGLLGADLIGYHTHDYGEYFLRCVQRILGYGHRMGQLTVEGRLVKVGAFPMGIDFKKFYEAADLAEVQKKKEELKGVWAIPKSSFRWIDKITLKASSTDYRALKPC
jgi:trehalose-6-phosphate synthase